MQGMERLISAKDKAMYINQLMRVGFDTLDFGSFVSPKAIPQMADTAAVLGLLEAGGQNSRLLAIVANLRGAEAACGFERISFIGFPFSVSETFQRRNTNAGIAESLERVAQIQELCGRTSKQLVIYISMGFGNPYGDPWNVDIVLKWVGKLAAEGIAIIALADTVGVADPDDINHLFRGLMPDYPAVRFGAHLHARPDNWSEKVAAAYEAGCRRFDSAVNGYGGCPMADDELVGNIATEHLIEFMSGKGESLDLNMEAFRKTLEMASGIFR